MRKLGLMSGGATALALTTLMWSTGAAAQAQDPAEIAEVVVTGSLIQGTATNTALPVAVLSAEDFKKKGSPTIVELIKELPISNGIIGDANQFAAGKGQRSEGQGSVNLRGLGPERTLVLLNGKRLPAAAGAIVDTQKMPNAAIDRIEILKDGAAATYGSDAIAGVVNFLTRKNFDGLEVGGDYRIIDGSKGDYSGNLAWGWVGDRSNILLTAAYQHRSLLKVEDRDFSVRPFIENPENNWSGASNPTQFLPVNAALQRLTTAPITDVACTLLGNVLTNPNGGVTPSGFSTCRGRSFSDLVEKQNSYQLYGELNTDIAENVKFHLEGLFAHTDIPHIRSSPSFPATRAVTATVLPAGFPGLVTATTPATSNNYFVPGTNPGLIAYMAANPGQFPAGTAGVFIPVGTWRPYGAGGNPAFEDGASFQERRQELIRVSGSLTGKIGENVNWTTDLTYGQYNLFRDQKDALTGRLQLALRGLGGPGCDFRTGTPGVGACQYLNPFSNAIQRSVVNGATNPGFNPAVANSREMAQWIFQRTTTTAITREMEYNLVFSGKLPGFELPGGGIGWAVGGQYRRNWYKIEPNELGSNVATPCADSPITGLDACFPQPTSPLTLGGTESPLDLEQSNYAFFAELDLPVTQAVHANVGARYEDYGRNGGSTFNPQFRVKWQIVDAVALRASIGSTFRAPPQSALVPDPVVTTQLVLGAVRPVEVAGNPDLKPEKAITYNIGAIVDLGAFRATVDYFTVDMEKVITSEPLTPVVNALFPNNGTPATGNCATLSPEFIAAHFDFNGPCSALNVTKIRTLRINGPDIKTSGIDVVASYHFDDVLGGALELGGSATWVEKYVIGDLRIGGVLASAKADVVGLFNNGNALAYPLPEYKGTFYLNYDHGPHNLRWTMRYIDSYKENRALFGANPSYCTVASNPAGCATVSNGQVIKSWTVHDLSYRVFLPWDTTVTATVTNVFDKDPPFARTEIGYDALTADPLGRTFRFGVQKRF